MGVQATPLLDKTYKSAGDISGKLFHGVRISADYTVDVSSAATQVGVGVLQNEPAAAGRGARVRHNGSSVVVAGAAFAAGAKLTVNALGRFIAAVPGAGATVQCYGIALQAALADGDQVEMLLTPGTIERG